jgi:hypothetical protein
LQTAESARVEAEDGRERAVAAANDESAKSAALTAEVADAQRLGRAYRARLEEVAAEQQRTAELLSAERELVLRWVPLSCNPINRGHSVLNAVYVTLFTVRYFLADIVK